MLPLLRLIQCKECLNTKNNKITLCLKSSYKSLHQVQCVNCNNIWLMCALHGIRFKYRRYFLAKEHVRKVHHPSNSVTSTFLTNISICQLTSDNAKPVNNSDNSVIFLMMTTTMVHLFLKSMTLQILLQRSPCLMQQSSNSKIVKNL